MTFATVDGPPLRKYSVDGTELAMKLTRLRLLAITAPILIVAILEVLRALTIGETSVRNRVVLDSLVAGAFIVFGFVMVRAISAVQQRLERQNEELLALHGASLDITAELSLDAVLAKVVHRARALVGAKYGALSVIDGAGRIEAFLTSGISDEQRAKIGPPPVGHGLLAVVLEHGERLRLDDLTRDPRSEGFPEHHPPMHSLLAVPVVCKSPFVGNLYLAEKVGTASFTGTDEETLARFAVQAAIAIDNAHLHQQVSSLAIAQERLHIAHEMHDGVAQVLGYVNTKAQAAGEYIRRGKTDEATSQLRELAAAAREAYADVRESIVDLRTLPHPQRSFADVLEEYVFRWREQSGISTQLTMDAGLVLPASAELQFVRIIQESLANVRKHSKATSVKLSLVRRDGKVSLTVEDDGVGLPETPRSRSEFPRFGLATMRERAESIGATFSVTSTPGNGTTVRVDAPVTSA